MDVSFQKMTARRQADELIRNLDILRANSPSDKHTSLLIVNDEEAQRLAPYVINHAYLEDIAFTLLDVTHPARATAQLIEHVRRHRPLTKLSLVTAYLLHRDGTSTLGQRDLVVDAFLRAAIDNPSVTSVSLDSCSYRVSRIAELLRKQGLRQLSMFNCRSLDNLLQQPNANIIAEAMRASRYLEVLEVRRSFEPNALDANILTEVSRHPRLRKVGCSIRNVATSRAFRGLFEAIQRPISLGLLGSELNQENIAVIIEGFKRRLFEFQVELKGCNWDSDRTRDAFFEELTHCPKLTQISIDPHCGLSDRQRWYYEEAVLLRYRLGRLREASAGAPTWQAPYQIENFPVWGRFS